MTTKYDTIIANLAAVLPELSSGSNAAVFKKAAEAFAMSLDTTSAELLNTEKIILDIINTQRYGKSGYYTGKAKEFQYGDSLSIDANFDYYYATIDISKQIVTQAAFEDTIVRGNVVLVLKVAKTNSGTGELEKLATAEKSAFDSYFSNFEIPGLPVTKISLDPNIFGFTAVCSYESGYDYTNLKAAVELALTTFRTTYAFNGTLYVNDIEGYIQNNVPGVRNFAISSPEIDSVGFSGSIKLTAGYFNYIASIETYITYAII